MTFRMPPELHRTVFDEHIKETPSYSALGKSFSTYHEAKRHVAKDTLRLAVRETKARLPLVLTAPTSNARQTPTALNSFDDVGDNLRDWLVEHVHTLLPALQLVAQAYPKPNEEPCE